MADDPARALGRILLGKGERCEYLNLPLGNRHGLIAGATGTGKTVTLQLLAEGFSRAGTAVFAADIKGDLAGVAMPGEPKPHFVQRARDIGTTYAPDSFPVVFWDLFGEQGHPIRAALSDMGPLLLARLLELNETQEGVLNIAFKVAEDGGLPVIDLKDLRALLQHVSENASALTKSYGNVAPSTIGAIQRQILVLENQGAAKFFGEPELDIGDFLRQDESGRGFINLLSAEKLMRAPRLYAIFLLWLLSQLFDKLPEVGDLDRPKLVFFFDEAHLLFDTAPKTLLTAIEQVVRLIRSKGVGVYFATQNPLDIPDDVLGQLGNRAQHALRAFTPREQKAVKTAAETFRQNPAFRTAEVITQLRVGEALTSMLDAKGTPEMVARTLIAPPAARVGPITEEERRALVQRSGLFGKYETPIDRPSASEVLEGQAGGRQSGGAEPASSDSPAGGLFGSLAGAVGGLFRGSAGQGGGSDQGKRQRLTPAQIAIRSAVQSAARSAGTQIARAIVRGITGGRSK